MTIPLTAFRQTVTARRVMLDAIARTNAAIDAGEALEAVDALAAQDAAAHRQYEDALAALYAAFGVKSPTYGGRRHTEARGRIGTAVYRVAGR